MKNLFNKRINLIAFTKYKHIIKKITSTYKFTNLKTKIKFNSLQLIFNTLISFF